MQGWLLVKQGSNRLPSKGFDGCAQGHDGHRGTRIGEAANPGPVSDLQWALEDDADSIFGDDHLPDPEVQWALEDGAGTHACNEALGNARPRQ